MPLTRSPTDASIKKHGSTIQTGQLCVWYLSNYFILFNFKFNLFLFHFILIEVFILCN